MSTGKKTLCFVLFLIGHLAAQHLLPASLTFVPAMVCMAILALYVSTPALAPWMVVGGIVLSLYSVSWFGVVVMVWLVGLWLAELARTAWSRRDKRMLTLGVHAGVLFWFALATVAPALFEIPDVQWWLVFRQILWLFGWSLVVSLPVLFVLQRRVRSRTFFVHL